MSSEKPKRDKSGPPTYKSLMALKDLDILSTELALQKVGQLIDASDSARRLAGIKKALEWCDALAARGLSPVQQAELDYFRANAWDQRRPKNRRAKVWYWKQPELEEEILCLRRARRSDGFDQLHKIRKCQIVTNLGNQLSTLGRTVEALEPWSDALAIEPRFWMARGNRGSGLIRYARLLYSQNHAAILLFFAHKELSKAVEDAEAYPNLGFPEALEVFTREKASIESWIDLTQFVDFSANDRALGMSEAERRYRQWCLSNHLFLNPINDAISNAIAADDGWELPDFVTKLREPPTLIGFFNQLKQEYVSARWLYYSGTHTDRPHFSDRDVTLSNTLDYPAYGFAVEQVRTSYRVGYSLFDKTAFFLNAYLRLNIPLPEVSFGRVWRDKKGKGAILAKRFERSKNLPLRGLYWLSHDLLDPSFKDVMNPDAQALNEIRNHLEHRYLKIHEIFSGTMGHQQPVVGDSFVDTMAYSVGRQDFEEKTLRLLKLSRAALIHVALAMHQEERRRSKARRSKKPLAGQSLPTMKDSWKR